MSILIKGIEMPKTCFKCKLSRITPSSYAWCSLTEKCYPADDPPPEDCPLVEVPEHGRLIDADALMENAQYKGKHDIVTAYDIVVAPTIIESEVE